MCILSEDTKKKANVFYCARRCKERARLQDETEQQWAQKVTVVAARSGRQADTKKQCTAAAVVATMTWSRCKGETEQQVLVVQAANSPLNCADRGKNPVQTRAIFNLRARKNIIARNLHAEHLV